MALHSQVNLRALCQQELPDTN
eukprot:COSAG01_NODE_49583_length_371_cov_0.562500_1_plen_21_part_10